MLFAISEFIEAAEGRSISEERKEVLIPFLQYIKQKISTTAEVHLNFICTHNSRRSQFSQLWASVAAHHYQVNAFCYSGGVEVTACNERTVASLQRSG